MIKGKNKLIAALIVVAGLMLTAYALLTPSSDVHSTMMGVQVTASSYSITDVLLIIIGAFMAAAGITFILFKEDYEPLAESAPIPNTYNQAENAVVQEPQHTEQKAALPEKCSNGSDNAPVVEKQLVLRLLTGDERAMFRAIVESGGEALQKDLIVKTKMSDAKVSRVLDRLVEKGVISKARHGVTNKVKVEIE